MALAACPLLRVLADPESPCYELAGGAMVAVHAWAACPLRGVDAAAAARAAGAHDWAPCLVFETPADLRHAVHLDVSAGVEAAVELGAFAGGCVDERAPPFERRFVSAEWGHGLFAVRDIPARCVLGEYGGVLRSEGAAGGADAPSDAYRVAYPAVDARGRSLYISARLAGSWARLINHAPARAATAADGAPPPAECANCAFHVTLVAGVPRVIIATSEPVRAGQQLLVDYGREYVRNFFLPSPLAAAPAATAPAPPPAPPPLRAAAGDAQPPPPLLAAWLFDSCADVASACLLHPFVGGLADGSTPLAAFTAYVAQDACFLEGFARAYALALAKCPPGDLPTLRALSGFIAGVVEELQLHAGYAVSLGVDLSAAASAPTPAAAAYVGFLARTAADPACGVSDVLAAMAPCMRLYAFLGCQLASARQRQRERQQRVVAVPLGDARAGGAASDHFSRAWEAQGATTSPGEGSDHFSRWIAAYSDPGFVALAGAVEALLARHAAREHASAARLQRLYREAFELEFAFFDAFRWAERERAGGLVPVAPLAPPASDPNELPQLLLVADWDDTITAEDTTSTYARLAVRAALGAGDLARARAVHAAWVRLEGQYLDRYAATAAQLLAELHATVAAAAAAVGAAGGTPQEGTQQQQQQQGGGGLHAGALLAYMCQLAAFDSAAVQCCQAPVVDVAVAPGAAAGGGAAPAAGAAAQCQPPLLSPTSTDAQRRVLSGLSAGDLEHATTATTAAADVLRDGSTAAFACVARPRLRAGAADCLAAAARAPTVAVHVLSLNWDAGFIAAALAAQRATAPGAAPPRWGFEEQAGPPLSPATRAVTVWANKLRLDCASGASDGTIDARVTNGVDKLRVFQQLLVAGDEARAGAPGGCAGVCSVYVGDSVSDLLPLLAAHVGIIVPRGAPLPASARAGGPAAPCPPAADAATAGAPSSSLLRLAAAVGVCVLPLAAASQSPLREQLAAARAPALGAAAAAAAAAPSSTTYHWQPTAEQLWRLTCGAPGDAGRLAHAQHVTLTARGPTLDGGQRVLFEAGGWDEVRALLGLCGGDDDRACQ